MIEQGEFYWKSILAACLPPLALLCLALQILRFPEQHDQPPSPWAVGLITAELMILAYMIFFAWSQLAPSRRWLVERTQSELLRREKYLHSCRTGAYFNLDENTVKQRARDRLAQILDVVDLPNFVNEERLANARLLDSLSQRNFTATHIPPDLEERLATYMDRRLRGQIAWFRRESSRNAKSNERFTDVLKAASVIAFLVTLLHVVALMTRADGEWPLIVAVLCIVLPPTGVVLVSISNAYAHRSRSQAYRQQARLLSRWEPEVQSALDQAIAANTSKKDEELRSAYLHTSIIVGIVEEALLVELYQFILMMERLEFEAAP